MSDTTNQLPPPVSPLASALDAPIGGAGQPVEPEFYDHAAYMEASDVERLRMLREAWGKSREDRQRAFFEGRMLELTVDMDEHPDWFDHGCMCASCMSY